MMPFGWELAGLPPTVVAGVAAAGGAALTALYLLRRRPPRVLVSFAPLWSASGTGARSERLARRLRRLFSWALQLAIFGLLLLAAADPRSHRNLGPAGVAGGKTVVLLCDRSASMQARVPGGGSRLDQARVRARRIIDGLGPDDRAAVVSFAAGVTAHTGIESDRAADRDRLRAAVDALGPSDEPGDLPAALAFATALLRGRPRPTLILIGDGAGPDAEDPALAAALGGVDLRFVPVGRELARNITGTPASRPADNLADNLSDNLAILAFSARRLPNDPSSVEVALAIQSFRDTPATVTVALTAGPDRVPVGRRQVTLAPGARVSETWSRLAVPDSRLEARLEDVGAGDALALDDRAFAVVPEPRRLRVLVVGGKNLFLDGALLGLGRAVLVERVPAAAAAQSRDRWPAADVVVFDGVTPAPAPTTGRYLYFDPHGPGSPWPERGQVKAPIVTDVAKEHPLVKHLALSDLNVAVARALSPQSGDAVVAAALGRPLIVARERPGLRQVGVAFDVGRSDLPLRSAFPLLVANALFWLGGRAQTEAVSFSTGRTARVEVVRARGAVDEVEVVAPNGRRSRAPVIGGTANVVLDQVGIYDLVGGGGGAGADDRRLVGRIAANLASAAESDIRPRPDLRIAGHAAADLAPVDPSLEPPRRRREPAALLVLAAALLLIGEWLTFHRRLTV